MTPTEFKSELKKLSGGYLFCGEEDYLKKHYLYSIRKETVDEGDVFNHIIINSENYSPERLFSSIESLPIMADKKLIEINSLFISDMSEGELDELCAVLSRLPEYEYNVLVMYTEPDELDIGQKKQPSKEFNALCQCLKAVVFEKETPARLSSWCAKHFASELIIAPPDEVRLLIDRCGCDMYTLASEIDKLSCFIKAHGRERLTREDVLLVSSAVTEFAAFDFANAILDSNTDRAMAVLGDMKKRKERPEIILSGVSRVISDLLAVKVLTGCGMPFKDISKKITVHEYKVTLYAKSASRTSYERLKMLVDRCYEADVLIKSTQLDKYTVLERLVTEASRR